MIETIEKRMESVRAGEDSKVMPGQAVSFTAACVSGDCVRQGDLYLVIGDKVPKGYVRSDSVQLVPGNTQGSRHCLDSMAGVERWNPPNWGPESMVGPVLVLSQERVVTHPTHGDATLLAGTVVECHYQREFDAELRRERRVAD